MATKQLLANTTSQINNACNTLGKVERNMISVATSKTENAMVQHLDRAKRALSKGYDSLAKIGRNLDSLSIEMNQHFSAKASAEQKVPATKSKLVKAAVKVQKASTALSTAVTKGQTKKAVKKLAKAERKFDKKVSKSVSNTIEGEALPRAKWPFPNNGEVMSPEPRAAAQSTAFASLYGSSAKSPTGKPKVKGKAAKKAVKATNGL